jgi:hypothetical protein
VLGWLSYGRQLSVTLHGDASSLIVTISTIIIIIIIIICQSSSVRLATRIGCWENNTNTNTHTNKSRCDAAVKAAHD